MDEQIETKNAVIESTSLGFEHGKIPSFHLFLKYDSMTGQGAGGCVLNWKEPSDFPNIIYEILDVVGAERWEDLPGAHIRAKATHERVYAIGNVLEDKWLDFAEFFKKVKAP